MTSKYLESLRREGRYSTTTLVIISNWLSKLQRFAGERDVSTLRAADLVAWRKELAWLPGPSGRLLSENTVNQAVLAVRGFYRWAVGTGALATDPAAALKIRAVRSDRRSKLTVADRRKLLAYPSLDTPTGIRNRAVLALLLETGISRPACSQLDLVNLQLDTGALLARGRKSAGIHTLSDGLSADLERYLKEARPLMLAGNQAALFINNKGCRFSTGSIQAMVRHALLGCGLRPSLFSS